MFAARQFRPSGPGRRARTSARAGERARTAPASPGRRIAGGEILFDAGTKRAVYRVEEGAICHTVRWSDGRHKVIEFAFPGDIIGLGRLDQHVSRAQAMVETCVAPLSDTEVNDALERDDLLSMRNTAAADLEIEALREKAIAATRGKPVAKIASLLLALASTNSAEGRAAALVADDIRGPHMEHMVRLSSHATSQAIAELVDRGLIKEEKAGIRLLDVARLERIADGY